MKKQMHMRIEEQVRDKLYQHCAARGYIIAAFVERAIVRLLAEEGRE